MFKLFRWGLGVLLLVALAGCGGESFYTKARPKNPEVAPRLYLVNFDHAFVMALHAVELEPKWKLQYFDKNSGVIETRTNSGDLLTVRVHPIDRSAVKIFAFSDTKGFSLGGGGRLKKNVLRYFDNLDSHLKGFDEEVLQ